MAKQSLDDLLAQAEEKIEHGEALDNIESDHHGKNKDHIVKKESIEDKIKKSRIEANEVADEATEEKGESPEVGTKKIEKKKKAKKGKAKIRSKKYIEVKALVEIQKKYDIDEAIELVKKTSLTKFDGNVEVHVRLLGKSGKPEQVRGMISYPHSNGKTTTVVILTDEIIEEILTSKKAEADIYLTAPAQMAKVAKLAKILGPKGKMPSPKSGTIAIDPEKTKSELEGGKSEYKSDSYGIVHQVIGKVSAKVEVLSENYKALVSLLPSEKIVSINLCATMGPAIKVQK